MQYSTSLDAFVSGRNTPTLTISGFAITLDATALTPASAFLQDPALTTFIRSFGSTSVQSFVFPEGSFRFVHPAISFLFSVTNTGLIDFNPALETGTPPVSGRNTTILLVGVAPHVAPVANAGADHAPECTAFSGASIVLDGSGSTDSDSTAGTNDDIVSFEWFEFFGTPSQSLIATGETATVTLSLGIHEITLAVTDSAGVADTDSVLITVQDTAAPSLSVSVSPSVLSPPNHKMVEVTPAFLAFDDCDPSPQTSLVSITSNEPDDSPGGGDGHTTGDTVADADGKILLRAERDGRGTGRVYTLIFQATDASGNTTTQSVEVRVPHDQRPRS